MSLFSRLFGKAQPAPLTPASSIEAPGASAIPEPAVRRPDRAQIAVEEEGTLNSCIERGNVTEIARLVTEGSSTRIRQLAAQAVEDPETIRHLIKAVRGGNDKNVYRILTAKRDALLEETRRNEQLHAEITAVAAALEKHSHRSHDPLFAPTLEQLEVRWRAVAGGADPATVKNVQVSVDRAREVIAQHLRQIALAASRELAAANAAAEAQRVREIEAAAAATAAAERAAAIQAQQKEEAEQREALATAIRQIGGLVRKAQAALCEGSSGRAAGLRRAIEEKLAAAPAIPAYLTAQIQHVDARLNELKDWKNFTVAPKRVELMEEMESLVGSSLEPQALANRIRSLQEEWRTLSRGAGENLEADWQRFQAAAHQAYEPCRVYFEEQSRGREENLRQRSALVARLEAFEAGHDWDKPDWRIVSLALRESRQLWRQHSPVDRAAGKAVQRRFEELVGGLQTRLEAEHARNVRDKRLIIDRAQQLRSAEDSRKAIDDIKELQRRWKGIGPVPHEQDRALWEEFRQHCDALFERRQNESAEFAAALEVNKSKAAALCAQIEATAALSGAELLEKAATLPQWREEFEGIGAFPRADSRALNRRFEHALEQCERAVDQQKARAVEDAWTRLLEVADCVRAYRLARVRELDPAHCETLRLAAETRLGALQHGTKAAIEAVRGALNAPNSSAADGDLPGNEKALRMLCIRAEILTELPTPPEDQDLRRQYQVQRLVQSMGQGAGAAEGQLDRMTVEWLRVGPVDDAPYAQLLTRFLRCRRQGASIPL